jgi:hypothetical protein
MANISRMDLRSVATAAGISLAVAFGGPAGCSDIFRGTKLSVSEVLDIRPQLVPYHPEVTVEYVGEPIRSQQPYDLRMLAAGRNTENNEARIEALFGKYGHMEDQRRRTLRMEIVPESGKWIKNWGTWKTEMGIAPVRIFMLDPNKVIETIGHDGKKIVYSGIHT